MSMTLTDVQEIKILPMDALHMVFDNSETIDLENPESDSTWEWSEVKQPNGTGGGDVVAYKLTITWIIPYGILEAMTAMQRLLARQKITTVQLDLKAIGGQQAGAELHIADPAAPPTVAHWTYELLTNKALMRPRTELRLKGLYSVDALGNNPDPNFFTQIAGF